MAKQNCSEILEKAYRAVAKSLKKRKVSKSEVAAKIEFVALCPSNRAGARFLMAAALAKLYRPTIDIRKPFIKSYSAEQKVDAYGGRNFDEKYVSEFITKYKLPCNSTTAFLTPGFRTKNIVLDTGQTLTGDPPELYRHVLEILDAIHTENVSANDVLYETVRLLIIERNARQARLDSLKKELQQEASTLALSSEDTINVIKQHLALKYSSRLPVLVVAAAYKAAAKQLGERILRLNAHTAADRQTGAFGDVEITLLDDDQVVTTYEMKDKTVTVGDIDIAIQKIAEGVRVQNYLFVTTAPIDPLVREYANQQYRELGGVEIAILDCIEFLRHFLHLFHRLRKEFLDEYQELVLAQPDSAVNQALKEAFLALRRAAQATE